MKTAITLKSLCIMRAERWTSLPLIATAKSTPCWPVWQWILGLTGSTMSPKVTYTAVSNQIIKQVIFPCHNQMGLQSIYIYLTYNVYYDVYIYCNIYKNWRPKSKEAALVEVPVSSETVHWEALLHQHPNEKITGENAGVLQQLDSHSYTVFVVLIWSPIATLHLYLSQHLNRTLTTKMKKDNSVAAKTGGCFPGGALVTMEDGTQRPIHELRPGDRVLASTGSDGTGDLIYSDVLTFLDRSPVIQKLFYVIRTEDGASVSLTAAHLLFVWFGNCSSEAQQMTGALQTIFASDAQPGQFLLIINEGELKKRVSRITEVEVREDQGAYAPLTAHGTLVVNGVMTSCYAAVNRRQLAHWAFSPLRFLYSWTGPDRIYKNGLHWYSQVLLSVGTLLLDSELFHPWALEDKERQWIEKKRREG
ncbi:indian hedgehog B protein-like isoform X2 [Xyrauchen texanus]|uniref:indian hedgehog B protein-like isoform X2 n=1 Tax=Xyrauchen texanus TaxID=154827 RepID=UPI0022418E70|nr:indian hedgehog B protein-like isoform X2 [Xyrauchen texanus]